MAEIKSPPRYAAFISYRHEPLGRKWAMWLHRAIENYRVPKSLRQIRGAPPRVGKVFRDEEELAASADLSSEIDRALVDSKFLIVICTPRTPHSRWVNEEVKRFRELGRGGRILALLVEGEPRESFPPALVEIRREVVDSDGAKTESVDTIEPLAADVRNVLGERVGHIRGQASLRLIATLLGVGYDELVRRDARARTGRALVTAAIALMFTAAMGGLTIYAFGQKRLAEKLRQNAEFSRAYSAISSGSHESGVDVMLTLPNAEELFKESIELTRRTPGGNDVRVISMVHNFGNTLLHMGRRTDAEPLLKEALESSCRLLGEDQSEVLNSLGIVAKPVSLDADAERLLRAELASNSRLFDADNPDMISYFNNLGMMLRNSDRFSESESLLRDVLIRRRRVFGEGDADAIVSVHNYAVVLEKLRRYKEAEQLYHLAANMARMKDDLGRMHPLTQLMAARHARILAILSRPNGAIAVIRKFGLPDPSTQPTTASTQSATQPVLIGPLDDDIGRFAIKIVAEWDNDAAWAEPAASTFPRFEPLAEPAASQPATAPAD